MTESEGQWKKLSAKTTWKKQVEVESAKFGLRMEDALCRARWSVIISQIAAGLRCTWPPSLSWDTATFQTLMSLSGVSVDSQKSKFGLRMEDALCRTRWSVIISQIAAGLRCTWPPSLSWDTATFQTLVPLSGVSVNSQKSKFGLRMEDALCRTRWSVIISQIAAGLRCTWPPSLSWDTATFQTLMSLSGVSVDSQKSKFGLRMEDALCRTRWSVIISQIAAGLRCTWPPSLSWDTATFQTLVSLSGVSVDSQMSKFGLRMEDALCRTRWSAIISQIAAGLRCTWPPSLSWDTATFQTLVPLSGVSVDSQKSKFGLRMEDALCRTRWSVIISQIAAGLRCTWPPSLSCYTDTFQTLMSLSGVSVDSQKSKFGLRMEDALCRARWSVIISQIAAGLRCTWPPSLSWDTATFQTLVSLSGVSVDSQKSKFGLRMEDALCRTRWSVIISQIAAGLRCTWPPSLSWDTATFETLVSLSGVSVDSQKSKFGLRMEDALCRTRWSVIISQIAAGLRCIWPPSLSWDTATFQTLVSLSGVSVDSQKSKFGLRMEDALCRTRWSVIISQIAAGLRCTWPPSLSWDTATFQTLVPLSGVSVDSQKTKHENEST